MSWDDDVRDADWRAYLLKNAKYVTDAGEALHEVVTPEPGIGERYGYEAPRYRPRPRPATERR